MGVNIVDPNSLITSDSFNRLGLNGIPDLSKMYLFVELTAKRRSGTILVSQGVGTAASRSIQNQTDSVAINMMGIDETTGNLTTKWSKNTYATSNDNSEGFGITDINITVNSSYVPTVDIEFVDIRGSSLFTFGDKSKYSVLFSFPPPTFTLTVKGYFGKALKYDLHLVRQSTKFDSSSGNYVINASFVGQKFAPLTDILFKYVDVIPVMNNNKSESGLSGIDFDFSQPPKNTRELIIRTQKLYDDLEKFKSNSQLATDADTFREEYFAAKGLITSLANYSTQLDLRFQDSSITNFFINDVNPPNTTGSKDLNNDPVLNDRFTPTNLNSYENLVRDKSANKMYNSISPRLYIAILKKNDATATVQEPDLSKTISDNLNRLKTNILTTASNVNSAIKPNGNLIAEPKEIKATQGTYGVIDITNYYLTILDDINTKKSKFESKQTQFKDKVNDITISELKYPPTIGNIFKILCDDVDNVFRTLKNVDSKAEDHHKRFFNVISGNNPTKNKYISPFPLVKKKTSVRGVNNTGNAIEREERVYPADVFSDIEPFPEVDFCENFITTFLNILKSDELLKMKENKDDNGNNKWIPITPLDSEVTQTYNVVSPYFGKFNPIPDLISELLTRFYIITQYSYDAYFYATDAPTITKITNWFGSTTKRQDFIKFIAHSEAANIVNSIVDNNTLNGMLVQSQAWKNNIESFYTTLQTNVQVNGPTKKAINIYNDFGTYPSSKDNLIDTSAGSNNSNYLIINNGDTVVCKDRKSPLYKGFQLLSENQVTLRSAGNDGSNDGEPNPIDNFINGYADSSVRNFLFQGFYFDAFTKQNLLYIKDSERESDKYDSDFIKDKPFYDAINTSFLDTIFGGRLQSNKNVPNILAGKLATKDSLVQKMLNDTNITNNIKGLVLSSMFGYSYPYTDGDKTLNQKFSIPAVIEVPKFAHLFMGGLTYYFKNQTAAKNAEITAYNNAYSSIMNIDNTLAGALNTQFLSENDGTELINYFTAFTQSNSTGNLGDLINKFNSLITEVATVKFPLGNNDQKTINAKYDEYLKRLLGEGLTTGVNPDTHAVENNYNPILTILTPLVYLLNYTQRTFYNSDNMSDSFTQMNILNNTQQFKDANTEYFQTFFGEVIKLINDRSKKLSDIEKRFQQSIEDKDIKNQTYYSFKSISDRWILGYDNSSTYGGLVSGTTLFENFAFVDRGFNDISDKVVIDVRPLIEMSKDYDVSIFTVMSRILSLNGFEFFPLQNFMNFAKGGWENSFKISDNKVLDIDASPKFVCMYIGGNSAQLDDNSSDFADDGIQNLESVSDFKSGNVFGFNVAFAKQNQSMFTNIELSTNEHKETNESLAILSEIAQDQSASSPVPKGQNLFSTYEQRSYTCKVQMLGDIMIQPTQYFILQNVPLFRGAYLILNVNHNITANHMTTSFEGVRIKAVPRPFVTDFATATGVKGGSADSNLPVGNSFDPNTNPIPPNLISNDQSTKKLSP